MELNIHFILPEVERVIFNEPATIIKWKDGTKTIVKCQEGDIYDKEKGMALCICKKALGNTGSYNDLFNTWISDEEPKSKKKVSNVIAGVDFTETLTEMEKLFSSLDDIVFGK